MRIHERRGGFTLLESSLAVTLLGSVLGSVLFVLDSTSSAFRTGSMLARMDAQADEALQVACNALRGSEPGWLTPPTPVGSEATLDFQRPIGVLDDGTPDPGVVERLAFEYDVLEANDGVDNDGDGLIDEGSLVLLRDVGGNERRRVLVRDVCEAAPGETLGNGIDDDGNGVVDDRGFSVFQTDNRLTVRITLGRIDPESQQPLLQTYERTVLLRN